MCILKKNYEYQYNLRNLIAGKNKPARTFTLRFRKTLLRGAVTNESQTS